MASYSPLCWRLSVCVLLAGGALLAQAQPVPLAPETLPATVNTALAQARVPASALAVLVMDAGDSGQVYATHRAQAPVNPASVMKLVTTYAALDLLGPGHTWTTPVYTDGVLKDGVLQGNLYLQGGGDPKLVTERLWLLMRRIQGLGIRRIAGDIVLDKRAFQLPPVDPGAFDGEPLRPYNAAPEALLINFKSVVMTFTPDPSNGVAQVAVEPPLGGVALPTSVPLAANGAGCGDWRGGLKADFSDPLRIRLAGAYPAACGERSWPVAYAAPERFAERAVAGMWLAVDGQLDGQVREGAVPAGLAPRLNWPSVPLPEVVRDVNKFSNNVMAQHLLLSLALNNANNGPATFDGARQRVATWWRERVGAAVPVPEIDNGAGLSRTARTTAQALGRLLRTAYATGHMPELMASLPLSGHDGTLRRSQNAVGLAHLKTGSLNEVNALAGYVHSTQGKRLVFVAIVNHPNAHAARPALQALVGWAAGQP
ncbi:D-alanyl-D-alanine carboxypeptidase/D-alanyl-D-alanine-endopeptidase [Hydrogenophaga atypica]|uniref:D-alanyl-D-alanine carboxypeptidase/D-alanyl-D-alanine-endopeptidase n=1 Tax=Hydrogenophaga atypica TaxID=249409 RepID=A0ABW2QEB5_9BURK